MSRTRTYNHTRFDGGMTDSPRDTSDLTKLAYISHLDIYRDYNQMFVMPGFISVNGFDGNSTGIKVYQPQDVNGYFDSVFLLAKRSNGTGSKIFQIDVGETQWKIPTVLSGTTEGADNLVSFPFLASIGTNPTQYFPVSISSELRIARVNTSTYSGTWATTSGQPEIAVRHGFIRNTPANRLLFHFGDARIAEIASGDVTWSAKGLSQTATDVATGSYTVGIATASMGQARTLIWDDASLLADQRIEAGVGTTRAIGNPSQVFTVINDEFIAGPQTTTNMNGLASMAVRAIEGEAINTVYRVNGFRNSANAIYPVKVGYRDVMTWYTYFASNSGATEFENGVWAFGKGDIDAQMGVSKLVDTSSLGYIKQTRWIGDNLWFVNHSGDSSISRLDDFQTGTYDVPATIETLIYGADTPYLKGLKGVSIVTENLPTGGSVVAYYRTDEDSAWVTMGTSDTVGKQKHNFTKANGTPIGKFQEIQFKFVITGKTAVKNILVAIEETSDLPF